MTFCGLCPIVIGQPLPKEALRVLPQPPTIRQAAAIIARVRGLNPLNDNRWCHAAAGAHSDQAGIQVSSLQLIQYGAD